MSKSCILTINNSVKVIAMFTTLNSFLLGVISEKYTRGVSAVESILTLDRLRQSVAVKELLQAQGRPLMMRKTASVPNFSHVSILFQGILLITSFYFAVY